MGVERQEARREAADALQEEFSPLRAVQRKEGEVGPEGGKSLKGITPRERLARLVGTMPGVYLRLAQRVLGVSIGTIVYHVRVLVRERRILKRREGRYLRLYPTNSIEGISSGLATRLWQLMTPAERIVDVLRSGPLRLVEVAGRVRASKQLAHYHLRRMVASGVVQAIHKDGHKEYVLATAR